MGCAESKGAARRKKARALHIADDVQERADPAYKVVIIGSKAVGKSSLVLRVTKDRFSDAHSVTIGAAFSAKVVHTPGPRPASVKLHIWDTAGEEMYRAMTRSFYRGAEACVLCYDITDRSTFQGLREWVTEFQQECPDAIMVLCGNKSDLASQRKVTEAEAAAFVESTGMALYQEASAKTNQGVAELFEALAGMLHKKGHRVMDA